MPRIAARAPAPVAPPQWPTLDETILAARAHADKHAGAGGLIGFYEAELAALGPQSRARQAVYAHELGELAAAAGDEGAAVKAWARALQADPSLRPNLWSIRRAFERRGMWPNVLRLLDAELRFAGNASERAELLVERGTVLEDRLGDRSAAAAAFNAATTEDPSMVRAFMALERRLLEEGAEPERHRAVLAGLAAATRDAPRRAALLVDLARLEAESGGEGFTRARAALDQALGVELGEGGGTQFAAAGSPASLDELERLARRAQRPEWRLEALESRLRLLNVDGIARPPANAADAARIARAVVLRLRQAEIAEDRGDTDGARAFLELAAQLAADEPGAAPVIACDLRIAAAAAGHAERSGRLALAAAAAAAPALRGVLYLEALDDLERAGLTEEAAGAAAQAEAVGLGEAIEARARRKLERAGDDAALVRSYIGAGERAIAADDRTAAAAAFTRAAAIAGGQLGQAEEELAILQRAWALAPKGELAEELTDSIEWVLARLRRHDEWSGVLDRRLDTEPPGPRRLALLERRADLLAEQLDDPAAAIVTLEEILAARPDDLVLRYRLVGLARRAGDAGRATAQLREIIARTAEESRRAELELELGGLLASSGRVDDAEKSFREALRLAPADGRARAALEEMFELRRRGDQGAPAPEEDRGASAEGLIAALRSELDAHPGAERAEVLLSRLAELQERERRDPSEAAKAYDELLTQANRPESQGAALRGLIRAYAALDDRDRLVAALEREHDLLDEGPAQRLQRARIAWAKERRGDLDPAAADHRRLTDEEGEPTQRAMAHWGLLRAAYRGGDAGEIAHALGAALQSVDPELTAMRVALEVEQAASASLSGAQDDAADALTRARVAQPGDKTAQLVALWSAGRCDDLRGVVDALVSIADETAATSLRAPLLRRAALLAIAASTESADLASRLAAVGAKDDATVLVRAELGGDVDVLVERLALAEGAGRVPWLLLLAEAQAARGELAQASDTAGQLLDVAPQSLLGLELDRRIRLAAGDGRGAAVRTLALGELLTDPDRAARILMEAGEGFAALGDARAAVYAFREALQRVPLDEAGYRRAREVLISEGASLGNAAEEPRAWAASALLELFDFRVEHLTDPATRNAVLIERAELLAVHGDRRRAEEDLRAVLAFDATEENALWPLVRLCATDGRRLAETRDLLERLAALPLTPTARRDLHLLVGEVESQGEGDPERAISGLEAALAIEDDLPTLRRLAGLLLAQRSWQRAIDARRRLIPRVAPGEGARLELEIAQVYLDGFADPSASREAALRALALDPSSDGALTVLARHGQLSSESAARTLEAALDDARGRLADEHSRRAGASRLVTIATLRGDEELQALGTQVRALADGDALVLRPAATLPARPVMELAKPVVRSALLDSPLTALFGALAESAGKIHPVVAAQAGRLAKVSSKQRDAELGAIVELARLFGIAELELFLGDGARVEGDAEHLVVGRGAIPLFGRNTGRFRAARALALHADRLGPLDRMDDAAVLAFVAAALTLAKVGWPAELAALRPTDPIVAQATRALDKAISRKEKKALAAITDQLGAIPDPRRFRTAVLSSAARAAMFVTGDLAAASEELGVGEAMELGRVAVAATFLEARRRWTGGGT
jgi:hypothetical protein